MMIIEIDSYDDDEDDWKAHTDVVMLQNQRIY